MAKAYTPPPTSRRRVHTNSSLCGVGNEILNNGGYSKRKEKDKK